MPSHNHSASSNNTGAHTHNSPDADYAGGNGKAFDSGDHAGTYKIPTSSAGSHSHTISIGNTGSGSSHNNMPPYLGLYVFKRTA